MEVLLGLSPTTLLYAFLGGFLPVMLWFYVLLREDYVHPEPRAMLGLAFVAGMVSVPFAAVLSVFFREYAYTVFATCSPYLPLCGPIILGWAAIEETLKYMLVGVLVLWRRHVDEAIDLVIYMITAALGFAALENALFLIEPFSNGDYLAALATGNLRFVGSTVLHVIASASIGFALAFAARFPNPLRAVGAALGLVYAIVLHAVFNYLIIPRSESHTILTAFLFVWICAVCCFAMFEVVKYLQRKHFLRASLN